MDSVPEANNFLSRCLWFYHTVSYQAQRIPIESLVFQNLPRQHAKGKTEIQPESRDNWTKWKLSTRFRIESSKSYTSKGLFGWAYQARGLLWCTFNAPLYKLGASSPVWRNFRLLMYWWDTAAYSSLMVTMVCGCSFPWSRLYDLS